MTHANTIATLVRLRGAALLDAAAAQTNCDEYTEAAQQKASEVQTELAQAADFSRLLRELDPENAENYPDPDGPAESAHPLVVGLRRLADRIAQHELPVWSNGAQIEVSLHGVFESAARAFATAYEVDSSAVAESFSGRTSWLAVKDEHAEDSDESPKAITTEFTLYMEPDPDPVPAQETELAEAGSAVAE